MKSFKKIAIATAAALALVGIQTVNASAAPLVVTVAGSANSTTPTAPATANVPADNAVDSADAVALSATADTGTTVTFAASGVKIVTALNTTNAPVLASAGSSTHSAVSAGSAITVYAFSTSSAIGSVTITNGAYSTIVYVKGNVGAAHNVGVTVPAATAVGTIPSVTVNVTDVFGNAVGGETVTATLIGGTWADGSISKSIVTDTTTNSASGAILGLKSEKLAVATAGTITIAVTGAASATAVTGLNAPVKAAVAAFTVTDLNGTISALQAQVNSLSAQLAAEKAGRVADKVAADKAFSDAKATSDSATIATKAASDLALATAETKYKAEYNALAKKWNKKNPKAKVALKK